MAEEDDLDVLKACGQLLKLGNSNEKINLQINQDPKAVNLMVALKTKSGLKIIENVNKIIGGQNVYSQEDHEFKVTKMVLTSIGANLERLMPPGGSLWTCSICQESCSGDKDNVISHLR